VSDIREKPQTALQATLTSTRQSAFTKYQQMVIGRAGLWAFLKFEVLTGFLGGLPGAAGFLLRKIFFPGLLGACGRGVVFGRHVTLRHAHKIKIGNNCIIDDYCVLDAKGDGNQGILIGDNVVLARNTVVSCKGGDITIGDNSNISLNCMIHSETKVEIGKNNLYAAYCYIIGGGKHSFDRTDVPIIQQESMSEGVIMEDNIWLGAAVKVLDGARVGHDAVIGTGSVVNKDIPPFSVAVGLPARVVRQRDSQ